MLINNWAIVAVLAGSFLTLSCGEKKNFEDLNGEFGNVPGEFDVRLSPTNRDKVDALGAKLDGFIPGLTGKFTAKYADSEETADAKGTKLSDLLKIEIPGTESDLINTEIFNGLVSLKGDDGTSWFDVVDTAKYLSGPYRYAEMNLVQTDPEEVNQYYLDMIRWHEARALSEFAELVKNAAPTVVAVLDTGVLATHEDLAGVMWNYGGKVGYDATEAAGIAWGPDDTSDANGHGTHVAGIIGAQGGNAKGIYGVGYATGMVADAAKSVTEIMAVKVLNDEGAGTSEMINRGVKWAVDQYRAQKAEAGREKQHLIMNMSLGGPFDTNGYEFPDADKDGHPDLSDDIFTYATKNDDVLILVAAGNESCGISGSCSIYGDDYVKTYYYPCSYQGVLCVAATTHEDKLAGFSNRKASVGISAPGYQIVSTVPTSESDYGYYSGTSQATPVTAGAAALLWSLYPDLKASELKSILQKSAAQVSDITSEISSTDGRLDLEAAFGYAKQLAASGKTAAEEEPGAEVVKKEKTTPKTAPAPGDVDPNAPSSNTEANQKETTSKDCGVIGGGTSQHPLGLLLLLLPLGVPLLRRRI